MITRKIIIFIKNKNTKFKIIKISLENKKFAIKLHGKTAKEWDKIKKHINEWDLFEFSFKFTENLRKLKEKYLNSSTSKQNNLETSSNSQSSCVVVHNKKIKKLVHEDLQRRYRDLFKKQEEMKKLENIYTGEYVEDY